MRLGIRAFFLLSICGCSFGESEFQTPTVHRAVEIVHVGYEPESDCIRVGPISMPSQNLGALGSATGGAEADFIHELTGKALRMKANLVVPSAEIEAMDAAASGQPFVGDAYRCPR